MNRTFVAVLLAAGLLAAAPSLASDTRTDLRGAEPATSSVSGGGGVGTLVTPEQAQAAVTGDEQQVTGEVVMVTPSEITLHTASGMKRFELTRETQETLAPVEGETVTLYYVPAPGTARASVIHEASAAPTGASNGVQQAAETSAAPALGMNTDHPEEAAIAAEATTPQPVSAPASMPETPTRVKRLPKTASETPLIGLAGLLALSGAAVLRLAVRS